MGWSYGIDESRPKGDQEIGYSIAAKCDYPGCKEDIDRGLAFVCGGEHYGGDDGCGGFFCSEHRSHVIVETPRAEYFSADLCQECGELWEKATVVNMVVEDYPELWKLIKVTIGEDFEDWMFINMHDFNNYTPYELLQNGMEEELINYLEDFLKGDLV